MLDEVVVLVVDVDEVEADVVYPIDVLVVSADVVLVILELEEVLTGIEVVLEVVELVVDNAVVVPSQLYPMPEEQVALLIEKQPCVGLLQ